MPRLFHITSGTPVPFVLCMIRPNWEDGLRVSHEFDTQEVESLTGIESLIPTREAYRVKASCEYILEATDAVEFRDALADLGALRFALPLWVDDLPSADYLAQRVYASQYSVSYDEASVSLNTGMLPRRVGIVVGRLSSPPKVTPLSGHVSSVSLEINEDSPWQMRVQTNAFGPDAFQFTPNWSGQLAETTKWKIKTETFGSSREQALRGDEAAFKKGQEASFLLKSREEIRHFITFFESRKGSHQSFTAPIFYTPDDAPENKTMRFVDDTLTVEYITNTVASVRVKLIEQLVLSVGQPSQQRPGRAWLYTLQFEAGTTHRYTTHERALVFGGETYEPENLEHSSFTQGLAPEGDSVELRADNFPGNPFKAFILLDLERKLSLSIRECDPAAPSGAVEIFNGEVLSVSASGRTFKISAATLGGAMRRSIPRFLIQRTCNYTLGDACCGIDLQTLKRSGTVTSQNGFTVDVATTANEAANYFAPGWALFGSGVSAERRAVVSSEPISGGQRLTLHRTLKQTGSLAVEFYPGCTGEYSRCGHFSNKDNFGGFPHVPDFIESVATGFTPKIGK